MSDLIKSSQILKLAAMMQNSRLGISLDDIQNEFECSRRTAQRMKNAVENQFFFSFEEVENFESRKKRWKVKQGTVDALIKFTKEDVETLREIIPLIINKRQKFIISQLVEKLNTFVKF